MRRDGLGKVAQTGALIKDTHMRGKPRTRRRRNQLRRVSMRYRNALKETRDTD